MAKILLDRHSATEKPLLPMLKRFGLIEEVVAAQHDVVRMPRVGYWLQDQVSAWLREHAIDTDVYIATDTRAIRLLRQSGWTGKVLLHQCYGPFGEQVLRQAAPYLTSADMVWCATEADRVQYEQLVELHGAGPRALTLPYPADLDGFSPVAPNQREQLRNRLGWAPDEFVLIQTAWNITYESNVQAVLQALAQLEPSLGKVRFVVAGEVRNFPIEPLGIHPAGLEQKLGQFGAMLPAHVQFELTPWPSPPELAALYQAADAYIDLSLYHDESYSHPLLEAMACGLPTLVSAWAFRNEAVVDGETGFLADVWMSNYGPRLHLPAVVNVLRRLLGQPDMAKRLGQQARERTISLFHPTPYVRRLEAIIHELLTTPKATESVTLSDFGQRLHERAAAFTGPADPAYQQLVTPFLSSGRPDWTVDPDALLFQAVAGRVVGTYFISADPLWVYRAPLSVEEIRVLERLNRWRPVPMKELEASPDTLATLVQKGLVGFAVPEAVATSV